MSLLTSKGRSRSAGACSRPAVARALRPFAPALILAAALSAPAFGAGFELQEAGARALGMANVNTAVADDASAVFFNPAGLARFRGMGGMLGMTVVDVASSHQTDERADGATNQKLSRRPIPIPHGYLAMGFDLTDTLRLGFGGGILAPFGLEQDWGRGQEWGGRFEITRAAIAVAEPNANVAIEMDVIDEMLSVAVAGGFSIAYGELLLARGIDFNQIVGPGAGEGHLKIRMDVGEDNIPWRWNVAGMVRLFDNTLRLGISYRHQLADVRVRGRAKVSGVPALAAAAFAPVPNRTKLRVHLPGNLRIGVAYDPIPELTLAFDWRWTNWSILDEFPLRSEVPGLDGQILEFGYQDSDYFALGAEYRLFKFADDGIGLAFRAGLLYDETPIPRKFVTPLLPDDDRLGFTLGFGIQPLEKLTIDVGYMGLHINHFINRHDGTAPSPSGLGKFRTWANLFGVSVSLMF